MHGAGRVNFLWLNNQERTALCNQKQSSREILENGYQLSFNKSYSLREILDKSSAVEWIGIGFM